MSNIIIKRSSIQFKNPQIGRPSRAVEEHYFGRNVTADVDGEERLFRLKPDQIDFDVTEDEMIEVIQGILRKEDERTK